MLPESNLQGGERERASEREGHTQRSRDGEGKKRKARNGRE